MANNTKHEALKRNDEAALWYVRLHDEAAGQSDWAAFIEWLEEDAANRPAYEAVANAARTAEEHADTIINSLQGRSENANESARLAGTATAGTVIDASRRWQKQLTGFIMAAAAILIAAIGWNLLTPPGPITQSFTTAKREVLDISLADGSTLYLNSNTSLMVTFDDETRRASLTSGEALFRIAKDPERPFFVATNGQEIAVVGTVFNVQNYEGNITVSVAEGSVDVTAENAPSQTVRLTAGKQLVKYAEMETATVNNIEASSVGTWQGGFLVFSYDTLKQVVLALNRYFETPLVVQGEAKDLRFSGILKTDDPQAALSTLADSLPIEIVVTEDAIQLQLKQ